MAQRSLQRPVDSAVIALLVEAGLPTDDLVEGHQVTFLAEGSVSQPDGVVGLERFGAVALLRSLAVSTGARGGGLGRALVSAVEDEARASGVTDVYLLTTTADGFFSKLGYVRIARDRTPVAIASTAQFSSLCPTSAVVMWKALPSRPS